jgi:hypothetical protein
MIQSFLLGEVVGVGGWQPVYMGCGGSPTAVSLGVSVRHPRQLTAVPSNDSPRAKV